MLIFNWKSKREQDLLIEFVQENRPTLYREWQKSGNIREAAKAYMEQAVDKQIDLRTEIQQKLKEERGITNQYNLLRETFYEAEKIALELMNEEVYRPE